MDIVIFCKTGVERLKTKYGCDFSEAQVFYRVEYTLQPPSHKPVNENLSIKPCLRLQNGDVLALHK